MLMIYFVLVFIVFVVMCAAIYLAASGDLANVLKTALKKTKAEYDETLSDDDVQKGVTLAWDRLQTDVGLTKYNLFYNLY